jgi:type IV secretion system protein VirD4
MEFLSYAFALYYESPPFMQTFDNILLLKRMDGVKEEDDDYVSPYGRWIDKIEERNPNHLAVKYYRDYRSGGAKTLQSVQITLSERLERFNLPELKRLTTYDELELEELGEKKCVLFCLIPDADKSYNFLVSILYTQLFQMLFYIADFKHGGKLTVPVHFAMDEFKNVALPDNFPNILSTMRSRGIYVSIVLQNISQLKALFKDEFDGVIGNCDHFVYLGGNDYETCEYIAKSLDEETIDTDSHGESKGRQGSFSRNYQKSGRKLMTPGEVRKLHRDKCIIMLRGEDPMIDQKFYLNDHPNYRYTPAFKMSLRERISRRFFPDKEHEDYMSEPYEHGEGVKGFAHIEPVTTIGPDEKVIPITGEEIDEYIKLYRPSYFSSIDDRAV